MKPQWQNSRNFRERIIIIADLELVSPTHIGCGDMESLLDMPLARDPLTGHALLAGAAVAGALKAYLVKCGQGEWANRIFGGPNQEASFESLLMVDDSYCKIPYVEIRDGVAIDPVTRSAAEKKKYDFELMPAGMKFQPCFEFLLPTGNEKLVEAFARALKGLETGEIYLGKRKRRGFGECRVSWWRVWQFPWNTTGLKDWLNFDETVTKPSVEDKNIDLILLNRKLLGVAEDKRCVLNATFQLDSSLLIRSEVEVTDEGAYPDKRSLRRKRDGNDEFIISGTSLAGVFRARALRICNTLGKDGLKVTRFLFGDSPEGKSLLHPNASRLWVKEMVIEHPSQPLEMVQSRVSIDRFTGGALDSRLFSEQPVFGDGSTSLSMRVEIDRASDSEVGLLLLILKDLWLGDLPLGGESSIGRGLLSPVSAELHYRGKTWNITSQDEGIQVTNPGELQEFFEAFQMEA